MKHIDSLPDHAPDAVLAVEQADIAVAEAAGEVHDHPAIKALGAASEMADQPPLIAVSIALLAGGVVTRRPLFVRTGARMLAAHLIATGMKTIVKRSVDRTRPHVLADEGRYELSQGDGTDDPRLNSFPSGHTAGAVAVAEAIARSAPRWGWPARIWAGAIAAIQIPRCSHYPSDIAVGAMIGVVADRTIRVVERAAVSMLRR